ncbi:MAG: MCE family protein [Solirubrobacterales bacterium]|nr:MCE family protein [Solirubrobacterales bacterium]
MLVALAFTLSCVGLIVFVWTQFGGTIPFSPQGYRLHALFKETGLLVPNADVRISGVNVGKVQAVQARGLNSYVTLQVQPQYAPIPSDTRAVLRQKTLLGEAYIELSTGSRSAPKLPDNGVLRASQIEDTQALDQVLGSFDRPTQQNLQALLTGTAEALAGRGQDLNDSIGNLDPAVTELGAVVGELNQQQGNIRELINDGAVVLTTLGSRSSDLQSLITAGDQVFSATAARDGALTATVNALPPFLVQLRSTLLRLNTTLGIARPSLAALRPVAPLLTPALSEVIALSGPAVSLLREAPSLLHDASRALPAITRFSAAFKPALDAILPAARELAPIITFVAHYRLELTGAMSNLMADLAASSVAHTTSNALGYPVGTAAYLRAISTLGNESIFGQTVREPTNRNNTYYSPGELANLASGLLSGNCNNTGNISQVPTPFGNVPCRVQPPHKWGHGVLTSYYPHVRRAKLPHR